MLAVVPIAGQGFGGYFWFYCLFREIESGMTAVQAGTNPSFFTWNLSMHCLHAILSNKLSRALEARLALGLKPHDGPLETQLHSTSRSPGRRQGFTLISPVVFVAVLLCQPSGENTSNQWLLLLLICKDGKWPLRALSCTACSRAGSTPGWQNPSLGLGCAGRSQAVT